jgi:hypothetical protein
VITPPGATGEGPEEQVLDACAVESQLVLSSVVDAWVVLLPRGSVVEVVLPAAS